MEMFRICIVGSFGSHIEEVPFKDRDEARTYAKTTAKEMQGVSYGLVSLGEAVLMKVEVTDTFGGEANYSWVERYEQWIPRKLTSRAKIRTAKRLAGWTGMHCQKDDFDDAYTLHPRGICQVMFVNFDYDHENG